MANIDLSTLTPARGFIIQAMRRVTTPDTASPRRAMSMATASTT